MADSRKQTMAGKTKTAKENVKTPLKTEDNEVAKKPFLRTADGTIEFRITIPWNKAKVAWDLVVEEMAKNTNLPGFRKGRRRGDCLFASLKRGNGEFRGVEIRSQ